MNNEICSELSPEKENLDFLKSLIRSEGMDYGTVTLFIRPCYSKRRELAEASDTEEFNKIRSQIKLSDYEFYYTSRSQKDFTKRRIYNNIVGDIHLKK